MTYREMITKYGHEVAWFLYNHSTGVSMEAWTFDFKTERIRRKYFLKYFCGQQTEVFEPVSIN